MKKILLASAAMALATTGAAKAADILPPPIVDAPYIQEPVIHEQESVASGWYLRGDVGYAWNSITTPKFYQGSNASYVPFASSELRSSYSVGVGVGYQIRRYLRADVTLDYFSKADFRGSTVGSCGVGPACTSTDIASVSGLSLLANAYVDLGTYGRFTPYVGAGIGGTFVKWSDLRNTSCQTGNPASCDPTITHIGGESWRFTYALMAGTSIEINCNLKADVGYRYRNISGGIMFGHTAGGGPGYDHGMASHEGRAGLRYSFGGCDDDVVIPPPPIDPPIYK